MSALNTTLHSLKPAKFASFQQTLHCMHINAVPAALQHCIQGYLDQQSWKTDEVFYLFIQSPATPALSGGCCIVTQPIPCLHLVTRQQQPAAIQHNIKQSMERRQSGSETGCNAGPRDFSSKNEKYVKVLSIIFPNPRTGQNHTPAYNDNV